MVETLTLVLNGYYSFSARDFLRSYVGVGLGLAKHDITMKEIPGFDFPDFRADDTVVAYQAMAGIGYALSEG